MKKKDRLGTITKKKSTQNLPIPRPKENDRTNDKSIESKKRLLTVIRLQLHALVCVIAYIYCFRSETVRCSDGWRASGQLVASSFGIATILDCTIQYTCYIGCESVLWLS